MTSQLFSSKNSHSSEAVAPINSILAASDKSPELAPDKPRALGNFDQLPHELQKLNTFVIWQKISSELDENRKLPFDWEGRSRGNNDPQLHLTLSAAIDKVRLLQRDNLALAIYQPEDGLQITIGNTTGYLHILDLDGFVCDNSILELGEEIAEMASNSYMEVSPSGTGVKIYVISDMQPYGKRIFRLPPNEFNGEYPEIKKYGASHAVEAFSSRFWNCITGDRWEDKYSDLKFIPAKQLQAIFNLLDRLNPKQVRDSFAGNFQVQKSEHSNNTQYSKLTPESLGKVLGKISNQEEQLWSDVANALARVYGEVGVDFYIRYSRGDYNHQLYAQFDEAEVISRFQRALKEVELKPNGYGMRHLCYLAGIDPITLTFINQEESALEIIEDERILGDKQNGELFARKFRGKLLYVWPLQEWFIWNGVIWQQCIGGEVESAAKEVSDTIAYKALNAFKTRGGDQNAQRLFSHAVKAQNNPQIKAMIGLAKSEVGMGESDISKLDADAHLLGVANGVVDLRLGILIPPNPDLFITKQCNANYIPESPCPKWLEFLNQIFINNQGMIDSIQRLLGYTFTGSVTEEIMVICHGYGANGKSVMSNVIQQIAGGYGKTGAPSLLKARRDDDSSPRSDIAGLVGTRYISINEMQSGDRLDEQVVKMLAGREAISARALYKDHMTFKPSGTVWLKLIINPS